MEKELYEREERAEMQQEILKKVARTLPVYTRMPDGGEATTKSTLVHVSASIWRKVAHHVRLETELQR